MVNTSLNDNVKILFQHIIDYNIDRYVRNGTDIYAVVTCNDEFDDAYETERKTIYNLQLSYGTEIMDRDVTFNYSIFNMTDELYIGDFVDAYDGSGDVANLRVRMGAPKQFNFGVTINY